VRYGVNGFYDYKESFGSIACNNSVFEDPFVGTGKFCDCETLKEVVTLEEKLANMPSFKVTVVAPDPVVDCSTKKW